MHRQEPEYVSRDSIPVVLNPAHEIKSDNYFSNVKPLGTSAGQQKKKKKKKKEKKKRRDGPGPERFVSSISRLWV